MATAYIPPRVMEQYKQSLLLFAKGANSLKCIRSHYFPEHTGADDLTGKRDCSEIFVLANRANQTMKVSKSSIQIVANVLDVEDYKEWYEKLKELKRQHKQKLKEAEMEKANAKPKVLVRRRKPQSIDSKS